MTQILTLLLYGFCKKTKTLQFLLSFFFALFLFFRSGKSGIKRKTHYSIKEVLTHKIFYWFTGYVTTLLQMLKFYITRIGRKVNMNGEWVKFWEETSCDELRGTMCISSFRNWIKAQETKYLTNNRDSNWISFSEYWLWESLLHLSVLLM